MKRKNIIFGLLMSVATLAWAQVPVPAPEQTRPVLLKGATIHVGNGQVIENGHIAFEKGKITSVGSGSVANESSYDVRDLKGKHIYPGLIIPNSQLGLEEVSSVRAMSDDSETGEYNPNVRAQISYNTDSENIPAFRFNGILLAESTPTGGIISGSSSVMQLDAWNWEDATYQVDAAIHVNWPGRMRRQFDFNTFTFSFGPNPDYDRVLADMDKLFSDAIAYGIATNKERNLKLEALQGLFDGSKSLVIHTEMAKNIVEAVRFGQKMGVKRMAVVTDAEALHVADFLVENKIPVIVGPPHATPNRTDDDYDLPYKLAAELTKKGVDVSLSHSGMLANARNLPFYAGTAVAWGLPKEDALKLITLNPAKMLGIADRTGSLEKGKDANIIVSEGDLLDMRTSLVTYAFIQGREVTLEARQQMLYKKYSEKYGN